MAESQQRKSVADRRKGDRRKTDRRREDPQPEAEAGTTEPPSRRRTAAPGTAPWVVPTMVTLLLLGVAWIVVFYVAGYLIPFMSVMGNWNLAVGMGLIASSFVVATQWK